MEQATKKLVDIDIGPQSTPKYDLFSSTEIFLSIPEELIEAKPYSTFSYWKLPPMCEELPDLE